MLGLCDAPTGCRRRSWSSPPRPCAPSRCCRDVLRGRRRPGLPRPPRFPPPMPRLPSPSWGPPRAAQWKPGHAHAEGRVRRRYVRSRQGPGRQGGRWVRSGRLPCLGWPAEAFPEGKGTQVNYRTGSLISKKALASSASRAVNNEVQDAILSQLKAGRTRLGAGCRGQ